MLFCKVVLDKLMDIDCHLFNESGEYSFGIHINQYYSFNDGLQGIVTLNNFRINETNKVIIKNL